jgi:MATE family multidrug resistance protein
MDLARAQSDTRPSDLLPVREHTRRTLKLAGPVMLSRAGLLLMTAVDTVMCGRAGAAELAHYGIAQPPHVIFMLVGIGLMMGVVVLTSQADGAGRPGDCGPIWRLGLLNALAFGTAGGVALMGGEAILLTLGQAPAIADGGGQALRMFALGIPGILLFVATTLFLEGTGRSMPGMVVMALANLLNFGLNWLLMFGPFALGAAGAALGTSLTRWAMATALIAYVLIWLPGRDGYRVRGPLRPHLALEGKLLRLGWPMALSFALEHMAFFAAATFAGWLGASALAGYQIVLNTMALIYMLAIGISTATAVRVGNAVGRGDRPALARAGWVGLALGAVLMVLLMPWVQFGAGTITSIYTTDAAVRAIAVPGLLIATWILLVDAAQGILTGALRGAADIWAALLIQFVAFWLVSIPLCYLLAHPFRFGVAGLLIGLLVGLTTATILLMARFAVLSRRAIQPF